MTLSLAAVDLATGTTGAADRSKSASAAAVVPFVADGAGEARVVDANRHGFQHDDRQ
ncbi:hypothetical protein [Halobaculum lipolyticum]|uniref:Uncharacterized protein n=1 Tax=Halobaculum lipolyticum TaxID=3032001 RepID=A0ABD5W7P0_9EURY|nr:hypothetical protein [Halobaculum sp. DT31]